MLSKNTGIQSEIQTITPDLAKEWLTLNTDNRKLSQATVEVYANAIRQGDWKLNGDSIKFGTSGNLLDGQHRLGAVIKAKRSIQSIVITGVDDTAMPTLDVGKKRGASDYLSLRGVKNPAQVAASAVIAERIIAGRPIGGGRRATVIEVARFVEENDGVGDSVVFTQANRGPIRWNAMMGAAHFLFARVEPQAANRFFTRLGSGADLKTTEGVYRLREKLLMQMQQKNTVARDHMAAWYIRAWNADRRGEQLTKLHGLGKDKNGNFTVLPEIEG
jgi:phage tail tape-measure protein